MACTAGIPILTTRNDCSAKAWYAGWHAGVANARTLSLARTLLLLLCLHGKKLLMYDCEIALCCKESNDNAYQHAASTH